MKMSKECWGEFKNFTPQEFKCPCGCEKEYYNMDCNLIRLLQKTRDHFKKPITITCGHRCKKYNNILVQKGWAVTTSSHLEGTQKSVKAVDMVVSGYTTLPKRLEVIKWLKQQDEFYYCYHYNPTSSIVREKTAKNMGNAIHLQVK